MVESGGRLRDKT